MNEGEIRPAIERMSEYGIQGTHTWTLFFEERTQKGTLSYRFSSQLAPILKVIQAAAIFHKPGNIAPWNWMSVSDFGYSILFREDGQTVPSGDFQRFKEAVEQEKMNQLAIDRLTRAPEEIIPCEIF